MSDAKPTATVAAPSLDGRYDVLRLISEGGACVVHEAVHHETGRRCAAKVLRRELRQHAVLGARLAREARVLTRARHPAAVDVVDAGLCVSWGPYLVMELLEGRTIDAVLAARTRLALGETLDLVSPVAYALASAHARGVVHCDVKPANVVVTRREDGLESVKLIDWGLARYARDTSDGEQTGGEGERLGTAGYAAPEQWEGRTAGPTADTYALAVTIVECLVGSLPPPVRGRRAAIDLAAMELPTGVTPDIRAALMRGLAADPTTRIADPRELVAAIAAAARHRIGPTSLLGLAPERKADATRRAYPRAPYRTPVRVTFTGGAVDGHVADVSEGGVQVISTQTCAKDAIVRLRMALPLRGDVVALDARVRWVRGGQAGQAGGGLHALGLELIDAPADARAAIAKYVVLMGGK